MKTNKTIPANIKAAAAAHIRGILAETADTPLAPMQNKTTFAREAMDALGCTFEVGMLVAGKIIAGLEKRAARAKAKAAKLEAAKQAAEEKFYGTLRACVEAQQNHLQVMSTDEVRAVLTAAGLKADSKTLSQAKRVLLVRQIERAYLQTYRTCRNGVERCYIAAKPGIMQEEDVDWDLYRGQFKGWAAHILNTKIYVRKDYWQRVASRNLRFVGGMLVLDARPVKVKACTETQEMYKASWLKQGRGNAVTLVSGYIARDRATGNRACGDTAAAALKALKKATKA